MASYLISVPILIGALLTNLGSAFATIALIPVTILQFIVAAGSYLILSAIALAQNRRFMFILILVLAIIFILGPIARDQSTYFIEAINIINDCILRLPYELYNKVIMVNWRSLYRVSAIFINNALRYSFHHISMAYLDVVMILDCIVDNLNIFDVLKIPYSLWTKLFVPLFYAITTTPMKNKLEIFTNDIYGYHFPKENSLAIEAQFNRTRFEFDQAFGAQGPPPGATVINRLIFPARDSYVQLAGLIGAVGDLVFRAIADLGRPGQQFFPNMIVSVDTKESYWREIADLTCRGTELTLLTFVWPTDPILGTNQPYRNEYQTYACKILRIIACFVRFFFLLINDVLTFRRAYDIVPGVCPPEPSSLLEYVRQLLQGVPIVDLFVSFEFGANLNIFKSNLPWCKYGELVIEYGQLPVCRLEGSMGIVCDPNTVDTSIEFILSTCTGITRGSFATGCVEWDGSLPLLETYRIDYFKEFLDCIEKIVLLVTDPHDQSPSIREQIDRAFVLADDIFNVLILDTVYYIDVNAPDVCANGEPGTYASALFIDPLIVDLVIEILQYIYFPDLCQKAVIEPGEERNILLCLIALGARARQPFFQTVCDIYDAIDEGIMAVSFYTSGGLPDLDCTPPTPVRKRFASEHFTKKATASFTVYQLLKLNAAAYAYHGKEMWRVAEECRSTVVCNSTCSLAPCMPELMDCVAENLSKNNPWQAHFMRNTTSSYYSRNALIAMAVSSDILAGCADNALNVWSSTLASIVDLMRDFAVRYIVVAHRHAPTYERCGKEAHAAAHSGVPFGDITRAYLECIGLKPNETSSDKNVWSDTLEKNGVRKNDTDSLCAQVLHSDGFLLDELDGSTISARHVAYKTCAYLLAFGASSINQNTTQMRLEDFTDLSQAPFALLQSTSRISSRNYPEQADKFLLASSESIRLALPFESQPKSNQTTSSKIGSSVEKLVELTHPYLGVAYAYFNYLSELYENAIIVQSTGEEKDIVDHQLYAKFVAVAAGSHTLGKRAAKVFVEKKKAMKKQKSESVQVARATDFTLFSNSFYWVNEVSAAVQPQITNVQLKLQNGHVSPTMLSRSSSIVEGFVDVRGRVELESISFVFGFRQVDDPMSTRAFGYMRSNNTSLAVVEQEQFHVADIRRIVHALEYYSQSMSATPLERSQAAQAVIDFHKADTMLRAKSVFDHVYRRVGDSVVLHGMRTVLAVAWGLVANRIRPNSIPQYQAAHVVIDALTTGDNDALKGWLDGSRGYIPHVGYVSIESYQKYMQMENDLRQRFMRGYLSTVSSEYDNSFYLVSSRRNALSRVESIKKYGTFALTGSTRFQRWIEAKRTALNTVEFTHRSRFLRQKNLLHLDDMLHHAAGPDWIHYDAFARVANQPLERVELAVITASPSTADFWIQLFDAIFKFLGLGDMVLENISDQFNALVLKIGEFFFIDTFGGLQPSGVEGAFHSFWDWLACNGPNDYSLNGTGNYHPGCIPYIPEALLEWITVYPSSDFPPSIYNVFVGPGYLQWPNEMLLVDCAKKRLPDQCPPEPVGIFENPSTYFQDLCITDACVDPRVSAGSRPLCPVCDYCERTWKNAVQFGFTDGYKTIAEYDVMLRFVLVRPFSAPYDYLIFVSIAFVFLEFINTLALVSPMITLFLLLFGGWYEVFITQRIDRVVTAVVLVILTNIAPALGWGIFAFFVIATFGPSVGFTTAPPLFMTNIVTFISHNVMPAPILKLLVTFMRISLNFAGSLISFFAVDTSDLVAAEAVLTVNFAATPTFARSFYALSSFFNIVEILPTYGFFILLVFLVTLAVIVVAALFQLLALGCTCCGLIYVFFINIRNSNTANSLDDLTSETDTRFENLQQDHDNLSAKVAELSASTQSTAPASSLINDRVPGLRKRV